MEKGRNNPQMHIGSSRFQVLLLLLSLLLALSLAGCGKQKFEISEHLQDPVATINGETLTLQDVGFWILDTEQTVQQQALLYDADNPGKYWRTHVNGRYLKEVVRDGIMETVIHDTLFAQMAAADQVTLKASELAQVKEKAEEYWDNLSTFQRESMAFAKEDLVKAMTRIGIAEKYLELYCMEQNCSEEDARVGGAVYQQLRQQAEVVLDEKLWDRVPIGTVTLWENDLFR